MQRKIRLNILFFISFSFILIFFVKTLSAQEKIELALDECIKMALDNNRINKGKTVYKIKTLYYDLLLAKELIQLADEVKSNFEEAYEKSGKELESEDPDITQQDVLKLKLVVV